MNKIWTLLLLLIPTICLPATVGVLNLTGNMPAILSIQVNATAAASALDLSTTQSDLKVATVIERSNSPAGYTVTLSSSNSGNLNNATYGNIAYTATYNGVSVTLSSTPQTITTQGAQTSFVNAVKDFDISYTGVEVMQAAYTDALTFTIVSN